MNTKVQGIRFMPAIIAIAAVGHGVIGCSPAHAQVIDAHEHSSALDNSLIKAVINSDIGEKKVTPIAFPFYSPTLEGAIGLGALTTFSTQEGNENPPRSTAQFTGMYSTLDAFALGSRIDSFWNNDNLRAFTIAAYSELPDNYAGVGWDNGNLIERGPNTTLFDGTAFRINQRVMYRLGRSKWFAGLNYDLFYQDAQNVAPLMATDPDFLRYGSRYHDSGFGFILSRDTRDVTLDAREGSLFEIRSTHNRDWLGSDFEWDVYDFDIRHYRPFLRDGSTLAFLFQGRISSGDVPWASHTSVGSSRDLRGYHLGQYRDQVGVWGVVEYRHRFRLKGKKQSTVEIDPKNPAKNPLPGRQFSKGSMVTWVGLGYIGEDLGDLGGHPLPNAGLGYRFEIQDRRNIRADYGFGRDGESGFYLSFNQAF